MIKPLNKQTDDERYLTFTEAVKLLGAGTNNRVRNFVREGKVQSYRYLSPEDYGYGSPIYFL